MLKDLVKVANRLDSLGLTREADAIDGLVKKMAGMSEGDDLEDEDIEYDSDSYSELPVKIWEEPPLDIKDVAAAFEASLIKSRDLDSLTVTNIYWNTEPTYFPHYIVKAEGSYRKIIRYPWDHIPTGRDEWGVDIFAPEGTEREAESSQISVSGEISTEPADFESENITFSVEGMDGKTYYLYAED
jgi:hypothetical protein